MSVCAVTVTVWMYVILAVGLVFIVLLSAAIFIVWYQCKVQSYIQISVIKCVLDGLSEILQQTLVRGNAKTFTLGSFG